MLLGLVDLDGRLQSPKIKLGSIAVRDEIDQVQLVSSALSFISFELERSEECMHA